jgi:hypothetical protein
VQEEACLLALAAGDDNRMKEAWRLLAHLCADDSKELVARVAVNPVVRRLLAATVCPGVAIRLRNEARSGVLLPWGEWEPPSQEVLGEVRSTIARLQTKPVGEGRLLQCWQPFRLTLSGVYTPMQLMPGAAGLQAVEDASTALTAAMGAAGGALRYEHRLCDEAAAGSVLLSLSYADCEIHDADAAARVAVNAAACAATGTAGGERMLLTPLACLAEYRASEVTLGEPAESGEASDEPAVECDEPAAAADAAPFDVAACLRQITDFADALPEAALTWIRELAELPSLSAAAVDAEDEAERGDQDAGHEQKEEGEELNDQDDDDLEEEDRKLEESE